MGRGGGVRDQASLPEKYLHQALLTAEELLVGGGTLTASLGSSGKGKTVRDLFLVTVPEARLAEIEARARARVLMALLPPGTPTSGRARF